MIIFQELCFAKLLEKKVPKFITSGDLEYSDKTWQRATQDIDMNLIPSKHPSLSLPLLISGLVIWAKDFMLLYTPNPNKSFCQSGKN